MVFRTSACFIIHLGHRYVSYVIFDYNFALCVRIIRLNVAHPNYDTMYCLIMGHQNTILGYHFTFEIFMDNLECGLGPLIHIRKLRQSFVNKLKTDFPRW